MEPGGGPQLQRQSLDQVGGGGGPPLGSTMTLWNQVWDSTVERPQRWLKDLSSKSKKILSIEAVKYYDSYLLLFVVVGLFDGSMRLS